MAISIHGREVYMTGSRKHVVTWCGALAGFKEELGGEMANGIFPELAVVQDADRLDAIGAIGMVTSGI